MLLIHLREIHVLTLYFYSDIYVYKYITHTHKRILFVGCLVFLDILLGGPFSYENWIMQYMLF